MSLRFMQGFALGGEWGGAVLIVVEHSPQGRRGLFGSAPQSGLALGLTLSTLTFLVLGTLSDEAFRSWGWRAPFLLSATLVVIGLIIRLKISETPAFQELRRTGTREKLPIVETLRNHWKPVLLAALCFANVGAIFYALFTFSITYGTEYIGLSRPTMLAIAVMCSSIAFFGIPFAGALSDHFGRRRVFTSGVLLTTLTAFPMFWLIDSGSVPLTVLGYLLATVGFCASYGTLGVLYAESFTASIRYTGMSLGLGIGTILGSAFVPIIYLQLLSVFGGSWSISLYIAATGIISLCAVYALVALSDTSPTGDPET